jgi:hypothetical protein
MDVVATRRRVGGFRILASLIVILVAGGVCAAAFAQWSSASAALPDSMFSSASRAIAGGSVSMGDHQFMPGDTVTGTVVVANEGDAPGRFIFGTDSLVDRPGSGGGSLAKALQVTLTDITDSNHPRRVYSGALSGLSGIDLGSFAPGATRTYRIAATLQPQTVSGTAVADGSLALSFQWTAVTSG